MNVCRGMHVERGMWNGGRVFRSERGTGDGFFVPDLCRGRSTDTTTRRTILAVRRHSGSRDVSITATVPPGSASSENVTCPRLCTLAVRSTFQCPQTSFALSSAT